MEFRPEDYDHLIPSRWNREGEIYLLEGILFGEDDWYWFLRNLTTGKEYQCSCVGDLEGYGFEREDMPF